MDRKMEFLKVSDIFERKVIALKADSFVFDAVSILNEFRIASAPIVDDDHKVVGFISESDCIKSMGNCLFYDDAKDTRVESIMTCKVRTANINWDIFELETFFIENHLRAAPVVDSENNLLGIVSRRDILKGIQNLLSQRIEYKRKIKTPVELNLTQKVKMKVAQMSFRRETRL
ncbi:MAG: CBS domain-containing protein [Bacteriovoracaceae bacterium]|nr:CBS domain-containing protein [Bacteriovoracaceae bacterium]